MRASWYMKLASSGAGYHRSRGRCSREQRDPPTILRADRGTQVGERRRFDVFRWIDRVSDPHGRTRRTFRRGRGAQDPCVVVIGFGFVVISLGVPIRLGGFLSKSGFGNRRRPMMPVAYRRNRSRPAAWSRRQGLPRAPMSTPGYLVSLSNGSGAQSLLRTSSHRPRRSGSGPVAFSKQGSLTSPR